MRDFSLVDIFKKLRKKLTPPLAPYPSSKVSDSVCVLTSIKLNLQPQRNQSRLHKNSNYVSLTPPLPFNLSGSAINLHRLEFRVFLFSIRGRPLSAQMLRNLKLCYSLWCWLLGFVRKVVSCFKAIMM